jgi:hypothetical protein
MRYAERQSLARGHAHPRSPRANRLPVMSRCRSRKVEMNVKRELAGIALWSVGQRAER